MAMVVDGDNIQGWFCQGIKRSCVDDIYVCMCIYIDPPPAVQDKLTKSF